MTDQPIAGGRPFRLMTFNIRFDTERDAPAGNRWADRIESAVETIRRYEPDIVGFQEALKSQLADLMEAFPEYHAVGKPREAGETGEYVPLFLHRDRVKAETYGDFWLSDTPDTEGSMGWDATVPRHCTWARVQDVGSGRQFAVFNTHLDRWGEAARYEAAKLITARVTVAPELPAVVMGDLNATEGTKPVTAFLDAGLRDTFRVVHPDATDSQTVHHYTNLSGTEKLDYILCDSRWEVLGADIVREPAAGRLPSDHYPVTAELLSTSAPPPPGPDEV